ncbi:hypothetical protein [Niveispirillum fermenti]|uniref:hypothetical protein n=1 Tax=Niveispirillum fermenti TaxID=1233113 RepID=UPI003A83B52E
MGRLISILALASLLAACGGAPVSPPLQIADEHPHFANCAHYVQVSMPGDGANAVRGAALERCLVRNSQTGAQVATRL